MTRGRARIYSGASTAAWDVGLAQALSGYVGVSSTFGGIVDLSDHAPFRQAGYPAALVIEDGWQSNPCYRLNRPTSPGPLPGCCY